MDVLNREKNSSFACKGLLLAQASITPTYTSHGSQQNLLDTLLDVAGVEELRIGFLEDYRTN